MATFVLVHGAYVGGWAWQDVARLLRSKGHEVYAPTMTGLGERVHLARPDTDLDTHIQDIINVLFYENLHDVVLVSWSYGGMVVTGVVDRVPERIRHIIHIDGDLPEDGQSCFDVDPDARPAEEERARTAGGGWLVDVGDAAAIEVRMRSRIQDEGRRRHFSERFTSQPIKTFSQPIRLTQQSLPGVRQTFIRCGLDDEWQTVYEPIVARLRTLPDWDVQELPVTHFGPYTQPDVVAHALDNLVR